MKKRQHYSKEFKLEAVRLPAQTDKPGTEIALQPGVRRNQLYNGRRSWPRKETVRFAVRADGGPGRKTK